MTPIGKINHNGKEKIICGNSIGPITNMLRKSLIQIQLQDVPDPFNCVDYNPYDNFMETIKNQTRRDAREGAMQALFVYQYTEDSSTEFLSKFEILSKNKINSHFISDLYLCVIKNSEWADNPIKKHLQN